MNTTTDLSSKAATTAQGLRKSFEAWYEDEGRGFTSSLDRDSSGEHYLNAAVEDEWHIWQAALATHPPQQDTKPIPAGRVHSVLGKDGAWEVVYDGGPLMPGTKLYVRSAPAAPVSEQRAAPHATPESEQRERNEVSAEPVACPHCENGIVWRTSNADGSDMELDCGHCKGARSHPTPVAQTEKPSALAASDGGPQCVRCGDKPESENPRYTLEGLITYGKIAANPHQGATRWHMRLLIEQMLPHLEALAAPPTEQAKPSAPEVRSASMYGFAHRQPEPVAAPAQESSLRSSAQTKEPFAVTDAETDAMCKVYLENLDTPDREMLKRLGNALLALRAQSTHLNKP